MALFKGVLTWFLALYYVLYDHIARAIRAFVAIFKAPQAEPILPIAVTRNSFNKEFNPVEGGIRMFLGYRLITHADRCTPAIPWVQFNPAIRHYSQKARHAAPQYGTYLPSNSTPDHDASSLTVVLDINASTPSHVNASSPDEFLETSPLPKDNALVVYPSAVTSPTTSTELPPLPPLPFLLPLR